MADTRIRPVAYAKQEELDEVASAVNDLEDRLLIFETALSAIIADFDALMAAVESADTEDAEKLVGLTDEGDDE